MSSEFGIFHWKKMQKRRPNSKQRWKSRQMLLKICPHNFSLFIRYYYHISSDKLIFCSLSYQGVKHHQFVASLKWLFFFIVIFCGWSIYPKQHCCLQRNKYMIFIVFMCRARKIWKNCTGSHRCLGWSYRQQLMASMCWCLATLIQPFHQLGHRYLWKHHSANSRVTNSWIKFPTRQRVCDTASIGF